MKNKEKPKKKIISIIKVNPKVEEIVKDYPKSLVASPRGAFEHQLMKHLEKHKVK